MSLSDGYQKNKERIQEIIFNLSSPYFFLKLCGIKIFFLGFKGHHEFSSFVFSPKYRGKVLLGEVGEATEEIIRENCKELDIEVIDMAVNVDHVHLFIKYPPKYSVSWIAKRLKGSSSKLLRDRFPQLKEWCPEHLWAPSCYHGSVGHGWEVVEKYISGQKNYSYEKTDTAPVVVVDKKKKKSFKTGYITLYTKFFSRRPRT